MKPGTVLRIPVTLVLRAVYEQQWRLRQLLLPRGIISRLAGWRMEAFSVLARANKERATRARITNVLLLSSGKVCTCLPMHTCFYERILLSSENAVDLSREA